MTNKQSEEDYRPRGASQLENRQVSGTASVDDPSAQQYVDVTFDEPFASTPDVVGLSSDDSNSVYYDAANTDKTGIRLHTTKSTAGAVEIGYTVVGDR